MKIHKYSDVSSNKIGDGTTIWQYTIVLERAKIGKNCNIGSHCFIENDVVIGDRVTIKNGVYVFDKIYLEDDVFVGPNVTFTNDKFPRSQRGVNTKKKNHLETLICKGASIGGGSTILPGIKIGNKAIIGAGSIVTKDVKDGEVIYGNSAKIQGIAYDF